MIEHNKLQIQNLINAVFTILAFLMPVFFLPITTEFFEFNKLMLLTIGTAVILILWGINIFINRKVEIAKAPFDIAFVAFIGVIILSSIFSINKTASIFGSYGRWFPSLLGISALAILYYALASNIKTNRTIKGIILAFIGSITINSIITLLSYYNIYLGNQPYLQNPNFTPTGSITTTAILACLALLTTCSLYVNEKKLPIRVGMGIGAVINLFLLCLINTLTIWILLGAGVVLTAILLPSQKIKAESVALAALSGVLVAVFGLTVFPITKNLIIRTDYYKEVALPAKESWVVSSSTIRDFPLLGTGASTFYLNYPRYKSVAMNETDYWNNRFDKPYNELFNIVSTLGIVGIVIAVYTGTRILKTLFQTRKLNELAPTLTMGILILLGATLITYSTVLTAYALLLLLGLSTANRSLSLKKAGNNSGYISLSTEPAVTTIGSVDTDYSVLRIITLAPVIALAATGLFSIYKMYPSEYYMRKAALAAMDNDGSLTYQYQAKAINHNPRRDTYHNTYAQTSLALARGLAEKGDNTTEMEKETIRTLLSQAVRSSKIATEVLNPLSPAGWEIKANIYKALMGGTENADQWAIDSLNTAIRLDPTNPRLRLDLGGIYYAKEDYLSAANLFRQATNLKTDYANAYYNFAQALMFLGDYESARRALETVKSLVPEGSQDYDLVVKEIANLESLPAMAAQGEPKPTVEELTGLNEETEATKQESLINKGQETIVESTQSEAITE